LHAACAPHLLQVQAQPAAAQQAELLHRNLYASGGLAGNLQEKR
jgi:hypothetical protein